MTLQTLYDQLLELRIPAFRQALQEQQSNPQFTELAFEERLSLLVDHECTQRRENRIRRNLHTAAFPTSASLEELDLSPARGLERRTVLELGQCNWIPARQNILILGPTGSGKSFLVSAFGKAAIRNGFTIPFSFSPRNVYDMLRHPRWLFGTMLRYLVTTGMPMYQNYPAAAKAKARAAAHKKSRPAPVGGDTTTYRATVTN